MWWIDGSRELSKKARQRIDEAMKEDAISVSAISCWEIGLLVRSGRLELTIPPADWIARCEALPFFSVAPIDGRVALRSTELPPLHKDPADRIIVATALGLGADVVTKDHRIRAYNVPTVW